MRQVQTDHVMLAHQARRQDAKGGHNHAFADAEEHRRTHDPHAVLYLLRLQGTVEARGEHRDLVAPRDQALGQPLGVDGQAAGVWAVVGEND
jgi:hypothetical protein